MASLSCRISPRTSTVIFFDRSPLATAMVTSAMLRTWAVRFDAIEFTLSVRSFQTPVTSCTCAWPPSLPSVPTSRATRVTSEVNTPSCLIIVLTMVAERRNSPLRGRPSTSRRTVCRRSPWATAAIARVTSVVGHRRSSMRVLTDCSISPQAPRARPNFTRCRVLPSRPTTAPTRSSCCAMRWLVPTISLNVSAILPRSPGRRTEKSPTRTACSASSNSCKSTDSPAAPASPLAEVTTGPLALACSESSESGCIRQFLPPDEVNWTTAAWRGRRSDRHGWAEDMEKRASGSAAGRKYLPKLVGGGPMGAPPFPREPEAIFKAYYPYSLNPVQGGWFLRVAHFSPARDDRRPVPLLIDRGLEWRALFPGFLGLARFA